MRLHLQLTPNSEPVPFSYQHFLVGTLHKWLGRNSAHDAISLYSISWLQGGKVEKNALHFPDGAQMFMSFHDDLLAKQALKGALADNTLFCGMSVREVQLQEDPVFGSNERFFTAGPILIKKYTPDKRTVHVTYHDAEAGWLLTETLKRKLESANLDLEIAVDFDRNYQGAKTKLVTINGIANKANLCPVILQGDPKAVQFAWNVGLGNSTGSCFGAIK